MPTSRGGGRPPSPNPPPPKKCQLSGSASGRVWGRAAPRAPVKLMSNRPETARQNHTDSPRAPPLSKLSLLPGAGRPNPYTS
eukprot:262017-Prymnesium_polylepis.1